MRVLFYHGDKQWSGSSRAILAAARGLSERNHPATIACCGDSQLEDAARDAGIEVVAINSASSTTGGAWDLRKVIKDRFIEVAVVSSERDQLVLSSARLFADRGAVLRRVPSFEGVELQSGGKLALRMAASGLIVTTEEERRVANLPGWVIAPQVVPLGLDPAAADGIEPATRRELRAPGEGTIIACSYDDSGRYRLPTIFRTLALLGPRHRHIHVVIFGPGSLDEGLRMHASALGVGTFVSFVGDTDDNRRIMRAADAGWIVSGADNAAYACLDFMSLRVPVIADRSPLTQHYIADGITGTLLSAGDASYTASAVAAFLSSREKLTAMGNAARARVQREFPHSVMIDAMERAVNTAGDRTQWAKRS